MRTANYRKMIVMAIAVAFAVVANAGGDLEILTWPPGLAAGEVEIEVDLGASGRPAELFLDGEMVCTVTAADPRCTVDLGRDLHVHLLELIRGTTGGPVERADRWVNRPGAEAGLTIQLAARPVGSTCGGRVRWTDPRRGDPVRIEIFAAGQRLAVSADGHTFGYPCADPGETRVVAVSAVFPDGRRAEAVVETDASGHIAAQPPSPVAVEATSRALDPCGAVEAMVPGVRRAEHEGFEIVFVLDPSADYGALAGLGSSGSGTANAPLNPQQPWETASESVINADGLWYVIPNRSMERVNGFSQGRESWLGGFFARGAEAPEGRPFLADGVGAAGLMAGAGPNRRAVVLVLGAGAGNDGSRFSPAQVRSYLAEIGVPLVVLHSDAEAGDGWPEGIQVRSIGDLARAFEAVRDRIDEQCVEWFPAQTHPSAIAASLPAGIVVAGRLGEGADGELSVWRRVGLAAVAQGGQPITDEPVARERVEVTAVSVLVRTRDEKGRPVTDLSADDLAVTEDGRSVPVLAVEPLPQLRVAPGEPPAPVVADAAATLPTRKIVPVAVYIERQLAGSADIAPALTALAKRAEWLTSLGPVDIVVADRTVESHLERTNDPAAVRNALEELANVPSGGHAIERIRTNYVRYIREYPERGRATDGSEISTSTPDNLVRLKTMTAARASIFEEDALLRRTMARMNDWALSLPSIGPRLLFLVGTGFDEDPIDFYLYFLEIKEPSLAAAARAEFLRYNQATRVLSVGRELAAAGWMVVPVAIRVAGAMMSAAEFGGGDKFQAFLTDGNSEGGYLRAVDFMLLDPLGPQQHLAEASGGKVVMGGRGLDKLISESSGWYRLTYQVDRAPDGVLHEVAVTSNRSGVKVESTDVVVSGTSEGRAAMRLRTLLEDPTLIGELPVRVEIGEPRSGDGDMTIADMTVIVDFAPIAPLFAEDGKRVLRFSVAVRGDAGGISIHHQLATAVGVVGGMRYEVPIQWKKKEPSDLAVVVEDLSSSAWGGTVEALRD